MANQRHHRLLTGITAMVTALSILASGEAASVPALTPIKAEATVNYKKLYGKYLKKHVYTFDDYDVACGSYIYLDNDNIPELYIEPVSSFTNFLYTIRNGKVKEIKFGGLGTQIVYYKKKTGKFYVYGKEDDATYISRLCRLSNGKVTRYEEAGWCPFADTGEEASVNGKTVSKKRYNNEKRKISRKTKNWTKIKTKSLKSLGLLHYMK